MPNPIPNRTLFTGDNLPILRGFDSGSVELIYLDPPFNSNKHYSAPQATAAADASFKDVWTLSDEDQAWHAELKSHHPKLYSIIHAAGAIGNKGDKSYLIYMAIRLLELHRILTANGSLYLHIDPTMSHSLKLVLDAIFDKRLFQNELIWYYGGGGAGTSRWGRKHDVLLFYTKGSHWTFNTDAVRTPHKWTAGQRRADGSERSLKKGKIPDDVFTHHAVLPWAKERIGYPTQKPLALLERVVRASSNQGDMVLDPFCGCATTCIAAERWHRQWCCIDISPNTIALLKTRLTKEVTGTDKVLDAQITHRTDLPTRSDTPQRLQSTTTIKKTLYGNQSGRCNGCNTHFITQHLGVDYIVPSSEGGTETMTNLQLLCVNCNRIRGNRTMDYLKSRLNQTLQH